MSFDFDKVMDRRGTGAVKWDSEIASHDQPAPGDAFSPERGPTPIAMSIDARSARAAHCGANVQRGKRPGSMLDPDRPRRSG